jgi:hypothetical protein
MPLTIFFSWQADTPTTVGRNLIERALERAIKQIGLDTTIQPAVRELAIDRDTVGVSGSPPIVDTIFRKIDGAAVFVPDLTFVGKRLDGRPTPNPNVLIEYGWALKSLGYGRLVPVMNTAFGAPTAENMPFNMLHLRNPILFNCAPDAGDEVRAETRHELARLLEQGIRSVLTSEDFQNRPSKDEVGDLARTLHVELADRVARCCFDCEAPWHQYLEPRAGTEWKRDTVGLRKFLPRDPHVFLGSVTKIAILDAKAQQALTQFYYQLDAWKRDLENIATQTERRVDGITLGAVRILARRIHQTLKPGSHALEALAPFVSDHEQIEKRAIGYYDQSRSSPLAELSLRDRIGKLVDGVSS